MSNVAVYTDSPIADYRGNPLIEALPAIMSEAEAARAIASFPAYPGEERNLPSELRLHCIHRLRTLVQPLLIHMELESAVSSIIRTGYQSRNPMDAATWRHLHNLSTKRVDSGYISSASTFSVVGLSGMGKTTALEAILHTYPQKIVHSKYQGQEFIHTQITWLKLECPFDGSLSGLCHSFFRALDKALDDPGRHAARFRSKAIILEMIQLMQQLAATYFIGVLVIDELQHLNAAKTGGKDNMLNFFVNLINSIGIPVVFVGTNSMIALFSDVLRNARRACGIGMYDFRQPEPNDDSWRLLINAIWKYQWVKNPAPLTDDLCATLYDLTQGVTDFLAKFMILGQQYAIRANIETLNKDVFVHIARTKLKLLEPALAALRSKDPAKMSRFEDLLPADFQLDALMNEPETKVSCTSLANLGPAEPVVSAASDSPVEKARPRQRTPKPVANNETVAGRITDGIVVSELFKQEGWLVEDVLEFSETYRRAA